MAFFQDRGNLEGFNAKMSNALDMATSWGYAKSRFGFDPPGFDYESLTALSGAKYVKPAAKGPRIAAEGEDFVEELDENTIFSFTINFNIKFLNGSFFSS